MSKHLLLLLTGVVVFGTGCDTPWAAAKREREGISWEDWQKGIRTKEQKQQARSDVRASFEAQAAARAQAREEKLKAYFDAHPTLHPNTVQSIIAGELVRGMDAEQVRLAWGAPERINRSTGAWGEREQWVYGNRRYAYLMNGKLESWQTSE
jgi:hypothetical protein